VNPPADENAPAPVAQGAGLTATATATATAVGPASPLLIVTRPRAQAAEWVAALQALGHHAQALPLIGIAPAADPAPVQAAWQHVHEFALLMFVSANAVQQFFAHRPTARHWPAGLRAGSTGPGTTAALMRCGVPAAHIVQPPKDAPIFDSEALWAQLQHEDWAGRQVLVVRGEDGRDWLAQTLQARGAHVAFVAAYQRQAPLLTAQEQALLQQAQTHLATHLWLFSSSQAVAHLQALAPMADWRHSGAIASHPRIADAARALGFGRVSWVAPSAAAVSAAARAAVVAPATTPITTPIATPIATPSTSQDTGGPSIQSAAL
jgi:uroporphyrinogen-III synthase